jgi:restriction system protein
MPRYWLIAPIEAKPPDLFDKVWEFDLANDLISIGWKQLGDVSKLSRDELYQAICAAYPNKPVQTRGLYTNMLWAFYHEIKPGDNVIARRGRKILAGVGRVDGSAYYAPAKSPHHGHPHFLNISWSAQPRNKLFASVVFPMHTLAEISSEQFHNYIESTDVQQICPEPTDSVEDPNSFVLEKYLEDFIVSNFDAIFKGKLSIYEDSEGNDGQQYATDIGPIDILAGEPKTGSFVVIELKKGRPADQVVGQILRYMGWVKTNLCANGQAVKGLIVCREPDDRLHYALKMTTGIDVRYYSVSFKLSETPFASGTLRG